MTGRRTLGRVPGCALIVGGGLLWLAAATGAAVAIGRALRAADDAGRVPQLDVPLRHRTDLPPPPLFASVDGPLTATLGGAILALATSTDEQAARYWLARCESYGAPRELVRELWRGWSALHDPDNPAPEDP